jgi:hypothetical protein
MESGAGKYFVPPINSEDRNPKFGLGGLSESRNWAISWLSLDRLSSDTHGNVRKAELRNLNALGGEEDETNSVGAMPH